MSNNIDIKRQEEALEILNALTSKAKVYELGDVISGGTPSTENALYWENGTINWFTPAELNKKYVSNSKRKITELGLSNSSAKLLPKGTILFSSRASIGLLAILKEKASTNQGFQSIISKINNEYFYYLLINNRKKFIKLSSGSTFLEISGKEVKNVMLNVHDEVNQNKIANFLTSFDELIQKQEEYIAELKVQKKGYIYSLLSGTNNKKYFLKDLGTFKKGNGLSKDSIDKSGENKCILYGELFTKYNEKIISVTSKTNEKAKVISKGNEVLIPASTTTGAKEIAIASALLEKNVIIGSDINVFETNNLIDNTYLAYYLKHIGWKKMAVNAVGITIIHLYGKDLYSNIISVPSLEEQQKIGNFLSLLDDKIELQEQKLEQLKLNKKYYLNKIFQ